MLANLGGFNLVEKRAVYGYCLVAGVRAKGLGLEAQRPKSTRSY